MDNPALKPIKTQSDFDELIRWAREAEKPWREELGVHLTQDQLERLEIGAIDAMSVEEERKFRIKAIKQTMKSLKRQIKELEAL